MYKEEGKEIPDPIHHTSTVLSYMYTCTLLVHVHVYACIRVIHDDVHVYACIRVIHDDVHVYMYMHVYVSFTMMYMYMYM